MCPRTVKKKKKIIPKLTIYFHCVVGLIVRLALIAYGAAQDEVSEVQYTDVDYKVFTDAARHVLDGGNPYDRHTYRYSPIVAYLMIPNLLVHQNFGKILFALSDVAVAILLYKILKMQGFSNRNSTRYSLFWLYNPLTIVIGTRGNGDTLASLLVLLTLYFMERRNYWLTGLLQGVSIHFRLYPIIFSLPLYISVDSQSGNRFLKMFMPNRNRLTLVASCLASLLGLTGLFYALYGYDFLHESLLYHLKRTDIRHNYSVYFYLQYLTYNAPDAYEIVDKLLMIVPQVSLLIVFPVLYCYRRHLHFCLLCLAYVVVMFNSVLTCQYFIWYLSLVPLALPFLQVSLKELMLVSNFWFVAQAAWLLPAYLLEFKSMETYLYIWIQCLVFFWANVTVLTSLIRNYRKKEKSA
ncbi:Mannosyltransferase (PIG-M) [Nesidiocoris tenuis]|uniref:GPI alpha-1,4-mannosyltransferase I, catalytic subunit n=1 Tax=Nesidiocoris tenuis TaxID=355587 RepID=A0ABN7B9Z2_9HEMI|nr:Mannosyltransferase (PIG-M) [Nesidiocoris tenuis]